jgi:RimJ/RimL family protein N-acetyltransferase
MIEENSALWLNQPLDLVISTESPTVLLKRLVPRDAELLFAAIDIDREHLSQFSDVTSAKYMTVGAVLQSILEPENPSKLRFGIWDNKNFVGSINIRPEGQDAEVGYWVSGDSTGHGYATIAVRAISNFALSNLKVRDILASVREENIPSRKVLEKSGFVYFEDTEELINGERIKSWKFKTTND